MPIQSYPLAYQKRLTSGTGYLLGVLVCIVLVLMLNTGCVKQRSPSVDLEMQVDTSARPGIYLVTGNTNLPEQSNITVMAVRSLHPNRLSADNSQPDTTYSILARQIVKVEKGKWQTTLNLWQIAPDGQFQEAWQLNQSELGLSLSPAADVAFLALLDPASQPTSLEKNLQQDNQLKGHLVRFTPEGQWYVQASKILPISLPTGKTTPPPLRAEDINNGWGNQSAIQPTQQNSEFVSLPPENIKQTNAPLSPKEFMR